MRYPPYFVTLIFICVIIGIILSILNNDLVIESIDINQALIEKNINNLNAIDEEKNKLNNSIKYDINEKELSDEAKDIMEKIKEKEKELKERDIERQKKIEEEIKKANEEKEKEEKKRKEEIEKENKKKEEEKKEIERREQLKKEEDEKRKKEKEIEEQIKTKKDSNLDENIINEINKDEILNIYKQNKLIIACAYATDNGYVYPTLVAMTSLVENGGIGTFYDIYVMIGEGFTEQNKKVLKSVEERRPERCEVIFIDMGNQFKEEKSDKKITTPTYYRLELPHLLPNVDRIIWMDGDTAVFEDLTELITLDMKGNYIMGFLDSIPEAIERFNIKNATVLCAGVLLIDLDALRKNKMTEKFKKFMIEEKEKINQHDQTIINVVCQGKIAPLPPKYGIWCFEAEKYAVKHNERQRPHLRYNKDEFLKAYYHPAILHYVWPKPFWKRKKPIFNKEWWDYAKISGYYNEVFSKSPKYIARLLLEKMEYTRYQFYN